MKNIILLVLFLTGYSFCFSQENNKTKKGQHTIFAEAFGNGPWYSLGYDYTLKLKEKHKLSFSGGLQYLPYVNAFSISPQVSYLHGKNHHLELGVGGTYQFSWFRNEHKNEWVVPFRIGYRYQRENGGFFFKIASMPAFTNISFLGSEGWWFVPFWAGIAFGYTFK